MARAPYIVRKDGRYFFHKRFVSRFGSPSSLCSHIRLALRTSDYRCAVDRMLRVMRIVQQYEFNEGISRRASALLSEVKRFNAKADTYDTAALVERRTLQVLVDRLITEARFVNHPLTVDPPDFWAHWLAFCNANALIEDNVLRATQTPSILRSPPPPVSSGPPVAQPQSTPLRPATPAREGELGPHSRLSEALREFLRQRAVTDGDGRAEEDKGLVVQFLIDFLGDMPLADLSNADFLRVENALPNIPHPSGMPKASSVSLFARFTYANDHGWEGLKRISRARLTNGWHGSLHGFLAWARKKACDTIPAYSFELVGKENPEQEERDAWREEEILKLFSLPLFVGCQSTTRHWMPGGLFVQSHLYWTYLLIFFTGMRPSEIGKIPADKLVEHEGIWYFDLRKKNELGEPLRVALKARYSYRLVPVPRLLIDLGLVERRDAVMALGHEKLFPEWKLYIHSSGREMWGHEFSKSWQYIKKVFGFERDGLTIYGGRHTRATWYDEAGIPERIRIRVMGHAPSSVAQRYGAIHITPEEAKLLLSQTNSVEGAVAEILITAKLRADYGELEQTVPWEGRPR